jgi:hypothetical protein
MGHPPTILPSNSVGGNQDAMAELSTAGDLATALILGATVNGLTGGVLGAGLDALAGADVITGFRAVSEDELYDINDLGQFADSPGGSEGKYFSMTEGQAQSFGDRMYGPGNFGVVQGQFPSSAPIQSINPATEGPGFFVPNGYLPQGTPTILWP